MEEAHERLKALHKLWTELHEEQALVMRDAMNYASTNSAAMWRRYDSIIERKSQVMEQIRALKHRDEE